MKHNIPIVNFHKNWKTIFLKAVATFSFRAAKVWKRDFGIPCWSPLPWRVSSHVRFNVQVTRQQAYAQIPHHSGLDGNYILSSVCPHPAQLRRWSVWKGEKPHMSPEHRLSARVFVTIFLPLQIMRGSWWSTNAQWPQFGNFSREKYFQLLC